MPVGAKREGAIWGCLNKASKKVKQEPVDDGSDFEMLPPQGACVAFSEPSQGQIVSFQKEPPQEQKFEPPQEQTHKPLIQLASGPVFAPPRPSPTAAKSAPLSRPHAGRLVTPTWLLHESQNKRCT